MPHVRIRTSSTLPHPDGSQAEGDAHVIWWYGPIVRNRRAQSVPRVVVFVRPIDDQGRFGPIRKQETALTNLGLLRIGSIWRDGRSSEMIEYSRRTFDVSFAPGQWECFSPRIDQPTGHPFDQSDYALRYFPDANYLLRFKPQVDGGQTLLLPALEFYTRCYGHSAEVRRVLATYPWEEARRRLYGNAADGTIMHIARRLRESDAVYLWHVKHDPVARTAARSIYSQLEVRFGAGQVYGFIRVVPWYVGPARLMVDGLSVDGGRSYLGLRILGASQPAGPPVLYGREVESEVGESDVGDGGDGYRPRVMRRPAGDIDLTHDQEPDHGASSLPIEEMEFKILGEPRRVVRSESSADATRAHRRGVPDDSTEWSTGEAHGARTGTGHASLYSRPVLESEGVLIDVWRACESLRDRYPRIIHRVDWFTFEHGFEPAAECSLPKLIAFEPYDENTSDPRLDVRWPYLRPQEHVLRGALVIRVRLRDCDVYLYEIQRRIRDDRSDQEAFRGLAFTLDDSAEFQSWLRHLVARTREVRGVVSQLAGSCPGRAASYKHVPGKRDRNAGERAVRNALSKIAGSDDVRKLLKPSA